MAESIADLRPPRPITSPESWLSHEDLKDQLCLCSLELLIGCGGPLREYYEGILRHHTSVLTLHAENFLGTSESAQIRRAEAKRIIASLPDESVLWVENSFERGVAPSKQAVSDVANEVGVSETRFIRTIDALPEAIQSMSHYDWVAEISPLLVETAGELGVRRWLRRYRDEMPPEHWWNPIEGLRYFAGHLRRERQLEWSEIFACDWSFAQALHSPHDESLEERSLQEDQVCFNPTAQVVRLNSQGEVKAFARYGGKVFQLHLDWMQGALLDELSETGKSAATALLQEAKSVGRATGLSERFSWEEALAELVQQRILLRAH